ncbi:MAG: 2-oxo acid dehydrogenase subunit E2 [Pseudomonadota bacterium]|nr:2-oxo acid dehydrogenase subunit E2 [Pseudomonadota bacterium]
MSEHLIKVPDIGEGIAEVEVVAWHVGVGDMVSEDQVLADVMTDKASVEIPSPVAGKVLALGGEIGEMLAVGGELIRIDTAANGSDEAPASKAPEAVPAAPVAAAASPTATRPAADASQVKTKTTGAPAAVKNTAPSPPPKPEPPPKTESATASAPTRPIASPALRARAWELGIDLNDVKATGTGGRTTMADLQAHGGAEKPRRPVPGKEAAAGVPPAPKPASSTATHEQKIVGLRRKIAQKMQLSKQRIPHYSYVEEVDVEALMDLRAQLNARWGKARGALTPLSFLVRAMVLAVQDFPMVNATFDDEAGVLTNYDAVHMGIATQTDAGLMVPVLRNAQDHDLWTCATGITRLADAARTGKAVRDELSGSTITLTSLGALGGIVSTPVINHPEVAIVGVNRMAARPMVHGGAIVVRRMMNLSSSFDHRVVDGAYGAGFVQRVRELLEHPALLFVE